MLSIKTKAGELIPLVLNKAQRHLHNTIKRLWDENKIIRIAILKARQLGISTYIEALIYALTSQIPNQNSLIVADDLDGSNYIFEMAKLYQEKMPDHLRTPTKKSNEKKLEFDGNHSQIIIDTAENEDAGRKYTFRMVHLSEYAFFKKADTLMLGLSQSVPTMARTMVIKETTANGFNFFKDEWDAIETGLTDEIPIFVPWFWGEEYQMEIPDDFVLGDPRKNELTEDEPRLYEAITKDGMDNGYERLQWRRWCILNNCGKQGLKQQIANFKQEYPSFPIEAFKASGDCFFDKDILTDQLLKDKKPLFKADIVKLDDKYILRKSPEGIFRFWERPEEGVQYCIGGDACSGAGKDWSTLVARRKDTNKIVATYRLKSDPDDLAQHARLLGEVLNQATVAIENDKYGFAANQKLKRKYGKIFKRYVIDKKNDQRIEKIGWDTNAVTRPTMLAAMQEEIKDEVLDLCDKDLIKESLTFIVDPETNKAEAQEGCNDDYVIACAISGMVRRLEPYKRPRPKPRMSPDALPKNGGFGF